MIESNGEVSDLSIISHQKNLAAQVDRRLLNQIISPRLMTPAINKTFEENLS